MFSPLLSYNCVNNNPAYLFTYPIPFLFFSVASICKNPSNERLNKKERVICDFLEINDFLISYHYHYYYYLDSITRIYSQLQTASSETEKKEIFEVRLPLAAV